MKRDCEGALKAFVLAAGLLAASAWPIPALAMGGTDAGSDAGATATDAAAAAEAGAAEAGAGGEAPGGEGAGDAGGEGAVVTCPDGFEISVDETTKEQTCKQSTSGLERTLPAIGWQGADPAFVEAAVLAHSGQYERAIAAFEALGRPDDPYVLNYLGYSNRKLGNVEAALAYYHKALSIRPDYVRVREYLGEGYLALGRLDAARAQLVLIAGTCGTGCDAYRDLNAAIDAHVGPQATQAVRG